jgi:hypothetical protein
MFLRTKARGKTRRWMAGCCVEGYRRFAPDTELKGDMKKEWILEEGDRGGHD